MLHLFSNGDAVVKTYMAKPQVMEHILRALPSLPHDVLHLVLKSVRNISMESTTLDLLESAGAIPALVPLLSSPYADVQNQVLLSMYYLSTINTNRQEQAARAGIIPHLQRFIRANHPLKQFALPIIFQVGARVRRRPRRWLHGACARSWRRHRRARVWNSKSTTAWCSSWTSWKRATGARTRWRRLPLGTT